MRIAKLSVCNLVSILFLFGPFALPCSAQRSARSWDELVQYQADFLRVFYPESVGKKYWITFEIATSYDEVGNSAAPKDFKFFDVDVGDGPKSSEIMCCVHELMGGIIGTNDAQQKPVPLPPKPKLMNVVAEGWSIRINICGLSLFSTRTADYLDSVDYLISRPTNRIFGEN